MKETRIHVNNAQYQKFEVLRSNRNKRFRYGSFLVEGVRNINEAIRNSWVIESFLYSFETKLSGWATALLETVRTQENFALTAPLMAGLSGKTDTSELLAVVKMREEKPDQIPLSDNPVLVLFDRPSNKGNLGTLIRSCDALDVDALIVTGHAVDPYDPETITASMGSFFKVPIIRIANHEDLLAYMSELKTAYPELTIAGTSAHGEKAVFQHDFTQPAMIMIGNETEGLSFNLQNKCDLMLTIPMAPNSSATSLNVACAASIVFYEIARQRAISGMEGLL